MISAANSMRAPLARSIVAVMTMLNAISGHAEPARSPIQAQGKDHSFVIGRQQAPASGLVFAEDDALVTAAIEHNGEARRHTNAAPRAAQGNDPIPSLRPGDACSWEQVAAKYGVNPHVLYAIARTESNFNPKAVNKANANKTEDVGMMQINSWWFPRLQRDFGLSRADLFDACVSLDVGAWILADNMRRLVNTWDAIGAYNAVSPHKRQRYAELIYRNLPK